jgi:hypothetical protein
MVPSSIQSLAHAAVGFGLRNAAWVRYHAGTAELY